MRIGNAAAKQRQNDVWGSVVDSFYLHMKSRDRLDDRLWPIIRRQVECALRYWREPDHGIWEIRGEPRHYTMSKVMCWVAVDRGCRLALVRGHDDAAKEWRAAADEIHAEICDQAVDDRGVFTQHRDTDALDASLLLLPLFRFLPPDDPRIVATVHAIADELSVDGLLRRYDTDEVDDGLVGTEGAFMCCSFWLVSALVEIGDLGKGAPVVRAAPFHRQFPRPVRRGARPEVVPPHRQLPAGPHPSGVDQCRAARDPSGAGGRGERLGLDVVALRLMRLQPRPAALRSTIQFTQPART